MSFLTLERHYLQLYIPKYRYDDLTSKNLQRMTAFSDS